MLLSSSGMPLAANCMLSGIFRYAFIILSVLYKNPQAYIWHAQKFYRVLRLAAGIQRMQIASLLILFEPAVMLLVSLRWSIHDKSWNRSCQDLGYRQIWYDQDLKEWISYKRAFKDLVYRSQVLKISLTRCSLG